MNAAAIWRATLERLETTPIDNVCKTWLQSAYLMNNATIGADDIDAVFLPAQDEVLYFTLAVPGTLARDVIITRWRRTVEDILADITGQSVVITVTQQDEAHDTHVARQVSETHTPPGHELPGSRSAGSRYAPSMQRQTGDYVYEMEGHEGMDAHPPRPVVDRRPASPYGYGAYANDSNYVNYSDFDESDHLTEEWDNEQRANILMHNRLNPRYTFDAFIVGNSNRLAHAASLAVAEAPGESYNPLFLYGGVGLGKTHLLHAIGHQGVQTGLAVLYVSSEQFTNEIINAIRYRTTEEFRAKYRSVDILLVDDIQFIAGKESTEEEFFHTFNSLYEMSKQIVICSDRPPKAIVSLEERLRSRFEWGLIADIQPPDLETRMAILRVKADLLRYRVPDDIIAYIAGRVQTNIRELEGCLNRLMAYQQLHQAELTMDMARAAMSSLVQDSREVRLTSKQIAQAVAEYYHITLEDMCGKQRDKHIVMPRQVAMYLIRQETQASLLEIGQLFGGRDHSTVLHACEKIERALNIHPTLRREIVAIREQLMRE
ncbi:MAG TPA: chromosomal replication initiator protein DnaA [Ktedonobacteraceae bacterium]|jgi:chromosomal replication initiator protein|nr:chromosomal replication initiator protein DnaA [Ktedonobacteraceae bacterium]